MSKGEGHSSMARLPMRCCLGTGHMRNPSSFHSGTSILAVDAIPNSMQSDIEAETAPIEILPCRALRSKFKCHDAGI